jgi:hypothetical protein
MLPLNIKLNAKMKRGSICNKNGIQGTEMCTVTPTTTTTYFNANIIIMLCNSCTVVPLPECRVVLPNKFPFKLLV